MPSPKQKGCRLLCFPPEVRNNIYEKVFEVTSIIRPNVDQLFRIAEKQEADPTVLKASPQATVLALALTCRKVHNEALRFYYGRNTFSFHNTYDLYRFLYMIGEERRQCIKRIEILWEGYCGSEAARMVGECINLQRLYIGVSCGTTRCTKHPQENLWLSRGFGQLRKIRGLPNLDLRVREVNGWGRWCQWPVFNLTISEAHQCMFKTWPWKFDAQHIAKFEEGLKEEMGMAKTFDVEEDMVGDVVEELNPAKTAAKECKGRVLRSRKLDKKSRGKRTRKLPIRKVNKKGKRPRKS